jgi:hypothetical protein
VLEADTRLNELLAAADLRAGRLAAEDLSLCLNAFGRWRVAGPVEGACFATPPLRLVWGLLLARQGIRINRTKLYRLYKEERLTVRKRGGRKRALGTRAPMLIPQNQNLRWSLDFVTDTLISGQRFRILTLVDDFARECLGLVVDTSLTALRVVRELG